MINYIYSKQIKIVKMFLNKLCRTFLLTKKKAIESFFSVLSLFLSSMKRSKKFLLLSAVLHFLGIGLGIYDALQIETGIKGLSISNPSFYSIFQHNSLMASLLIAGGFTLGFLTLFTLVQGGYLFGVQSFIVVQIVGFKKTLLVGILHIPLELLALFMASSVGFVISHNLLDYLRKRREHIISREEEKELIALACFSFFLLFVAAIGETKLSTLIFKKLVV
jgi:uncharacterized membrane protein SpoIIM required for sporulation